MNARKAHFGSAGNQPSSQASYLGLSSITISPGSGFLNYLQSRLNSESKKQNTEYEDNQDSTTDKGRYKWANSQK